MREIKFRGMDLQGRWFYGNYAVLHKDLRSTGNKAGHYISNSAGAPFAYAVRPETVGQLTGLKDVNGKEIYEGDILRADGFKVFFEKVEYRGTAFTVQGDSLSDFVNLCDYKIEVVGNVYERPDLLGASASDPTESAQ